MKKSAGFTLVELMLFLVVLSVTAVMVIITLPDRPEDEAKEQAQRFYYRLQLLNDEAILNGLDYGLRIEEKENSYDYLKLFQRGWQPLTSEHYQKTTLPSGLKLHFTLGTTAWEAQDRLFTDDSLFDENMFAEQEKDKNINPPQIFVLSSGDITPFELEFRADNNPGAGWAVKVEENGVIKLLSADQLAQLLEASN